MQQHGSGWPYTPGFQFWGGIGLAIIFGVALGWLFARPLGEWLTVTSVVTVLLTTTFSLLGFRNGRYPTPP